MFTLCKPEYAFQCENSLYASRCWFSPWQPRSCQSCTRSQLLGAFVSLGITLLFSKRRHKEHPALESRGDCTSASPISADIRELLLACGSCGLDNSLRIMCITSRSTTVTMARQVRSRLTRGARIRLSGCGSTSGAWCHDLLCK